MILKNPTDLQAAILGGHLYSVFVEKVTVTQSLTHITVFTRWWLA